MDTRSKKLVLAKIRDLGSKIRELGTRVTTLQMEVEDLFTGNQAPPEPANRLNGTNGHEAPAPEAAVLVQPVLKSRIRGSKATGCAMSQARWTPTQRKRLIEGIERGESDEDLAKALGRTPGAIERQRLILERAKLPKVYPRRAWTKEDDETLLKLVDAKTSYAEIGELMERSESAVTSRLFVLRGETAA